jgi:hypothetical protein
MELGRARLNIHDQKFMKVNTVSLKPGDCAYIPMNWWYQINTNSTGKKPAKGQDKKEFEEESKKLSVSVNFWYGTHSLFVTNILAGVETGNIS